MMARSGTKTEQKRKGWFRLKKHRKRSEHVEPGAIDSIEAAIHILRRIPITYFLPYCIGTFPFIIAFFLFWNDMAQSGLAAHILPASSLGLALLFVWMKCWQAVFTYQLHCFIGHQTPQRLTLKQCVQLIQRQSFWQATGFITLGPALLITLPFGRAFAFYQNLTVMDIRDTEQHERLVERACRQAMLWPSQGNVLVLLFFLSGVFTLLSWQTVIGTLPFLARSLLGYQSVLANSGEAVFSSTTLPLVLAFTYLSMDPIIKTVYTLRCYYGEARKNGADLLSALQHLQLSQRAGTRVLVFLAGLLALFCTPSSVLAAAPSEPATEQQSIQVEELEHNLDETLSQREYAWRFPREDPAELDMKEHTWLDQVGDVLQNIIAWIYARLANENQEADMPARDASHSFNFKGLLKSIAYIALLSLAIVIVVLTIRFIRNRKTVRTENPAVVPEAALPDLNSETVTADSLSQNRWVLYAKDLLAKGSYRLAIRAYFLAQLAHFSEQGFIRVHPFKSNRDYYYELSKRSHTFDNLLDIYQHELTLFEGIWYGDHPAGNDEIKAMETYLTQLGVTL